MRFGGVLLGVALVLLPSVSGAVAHAQAFSTAYRVESWDERQGLPSGRIWSIAQDTRGYLWLGSEAGLLRFDGVRFVRWTSPDGELLPEESIVFALCSARDGSLWLGFQSGGVARVQDGHLVRYAAAAGIGGPIQFIKEDRDGTVWAGAPDTIYRFRAGRWTSVSGQLGLPASGAYAAYEDRGGGLWLSTTAGVFVRRGGGDGFERVHGSTTRNVRFSEDAAGRMWITDPQRGVIQLATSSVGLSGAATAGQVLTRDRAGTLWLGTGGQGLWRVVPGDGGAPAVERLTTANGLSSDVVRALHEDRDGNLWVGTESGLDRISPRRIQAVQDLALTFAIETTPDGSVWVATNDGLIRVAGRTRRRYGIADGLPSASVRALFTDAQARLWVATDRGIAVWNGARFEVLPAGETPPSRAIALAADSRGRLWVCDRLRGAFEWRNGMLHPVAPPPEARGEEADFVFVDRQDRLWIGYPHGIVAATARDGTTRTYALGATVGAVLTSVYEDASGALWIGGTRGLGRIANGKVAVVGEPSGLPGYGVFAVAQDHAGDLWLGVSSGLVRMPIGEFDRASGDAAYRLRYRVYDASDGLVGVPPRLGFPGAVRASSGALWFITSRGASVIDPRAADMGSTTGAVRIESVSGDAGPLPLTPGATLGAGTSRLRFEYTAVNLTSPMKDRFRYRLRGVDESWVDAGTRREAFYPNLRSGAYRFEVARVGDGAAPDAIAAWEFSIAPMFYETWWFLAGCLAVTGLGGWGAWQMRVRHLRRQFAVVFAERARMGRELHDTLLQNLVAIALHFEEVAASIGMDTPAAAQIQRLRRFLELAVVEARHLVWDLRSGTLLEGGLPQVLRETGERIFQGKPTRFSMTVTGAARRCTADVEQHLMRIGQEALSNASRYADATMVHLGLSYHDQAVQLDVIDDGRGLPQGDPDDTPGHYGLRIMRERAQQIGASFDVQTTPGNGTHIRVVVPAAQGAVL